MFSYTIKVRRINSSSSFKGIASVLIDGLMEIDGFKIINGRNGLFVSMPSHKGEVMEDGVKVEKYFDDVRFPSEECLEFSKELKEAILSAYNNTSSSTTGSPADVLATKPTPKRQVVDEEETATRKSTAATAKASAATTEAAKPATSTRERKPLWGY